jgi:uncharacterized repeat protein (TIGR03803 family)
MRRPLSVIAIMLIVTAVSGWAAEGPLVLYNLPGGSGAALPIWYGNLISDSKGNLYGTASEGGPETYPCFGICGSVFELSPTVNGWQATTLYQFSGGSDGGSPEAGLAFDKAGNLYGTTGQGGGGDSCGTVFKLTPNGDGGWTESVLHSFSGMEQNDGCGPTTGVILDENGNIFGTVANGSAVCCGLVYELTSSDGVWTYSVLHSFNLITGDGYNPQSSLVIDSAGNLYGTTLQGGASDVGTVFELSQSAGAWTEKILYSFGFSGGYYPDSALVFDKAGNLYGTNSYGGSGTICAPECGTVYVLKHSNNGWKQITLYNFLGGDDGSLPIAGVTIVGDSLYGTTSFGGGGSCTINGLTGCGTIFGLQESDGKIVERVIQLDGTNGSNPQAGLLADSKGILFGTTLYGGSGSCPNGNLPGCGVVYAAKP